MGENKASEGISSAPPRPKHFILSAGRFEDGHDLLYLLGIVTLDLGGSLGLWPRTAVEPLDGARRRLLNFGRGLMPSEGLKCPASGHFPDVA